jgi:hypothetical protein
MIDLDAMTMLGISAGIISWSGGGFSLLVVTYAASLNVRIFRQIVDAAA